MSLLRPEDAELHHCDGSHRELCPDPNVAHDVWLERLCVHRDEHRRDLSAGYLVSRTGTIIGRRPGTRAGAGRFDGRRPSRALGPRRSAPLHRWAGRGTPPLPEATRPARRASSPGNAGHRITKG